MKIYGREEFDSAKVRNLRTRPVKRLSRGKDINLLTSSGIRNGNSVNDSKGASSTFERIERVEPSIDLDSASKTPGDDETTELAIEFFAVNRDLGALGK